MSRRKATAVEEKPPESMVTRGVIQGRLQRYQNQKNSLQVQVHQLDGAIALCSQLLALMDQKEAEVGEQA